VSRRKNIARGALVGGLLLIFLAVFLDMTRDAHMLALAAGCAGAVLTLFAINYHRQHRHR
jgi:hypothetical protein